MEIAINNCCGEFSVSEAVFNELGIEWDGYGFLLNRDFKIESKNPYEFRAHPKLISALHKVGMESSSGSYASIKIIEIPDGVDWILEEYDGIEWVAEKHRSWS